MTRIPFVIDNIEHRLVDTLNHLLGRSEGRPLDIATAYFSISGYRLIKAGLDRLGAFRLLLGHDPQSGTDVGMRPRNVLKAKLGKDMAAEPFTEATLRLVEDLIAFLRNEAVQVRLHDKGFLHAKAYLFHQDRVGPHNPADRMRPYAAVVGSSNFTGPGLVSNRELNLVHRVILPDEEALDREAARSLSYLEYDRGRESLLDPSGVELPDDTRRFIKSEVGARAVTDLMRWYEGRWEDSVDFKAELIELLDASKFGTREYTPYEVYTKALYEYFKDELGVDPAATGRSAVELSEFQEDSVRKARRILERYDGVLIADSVGLGKTWIGKKLLEDFAYHRRQKALVICAASLRPMWRKELETATIAARIVGIEELGRQGFDPGEYGDVDVILIDESHNFRNDKANRYLALDAIVQRNGGRGRDGGRKKVILMSATPINNDLNDLANQLRLFTQGEPAYFREAGIGDFNAYFRRARRQANRDGAPAGVLLFNLLEEVMVRNTRPYIRTAYPNATIKGKPVAFPERRLHSVSYDLGATCGGLYDEIVAAIEGLSFAPYKLEAYRKPAAIRDDSQHKWEEGREVALVGIFKARFLKRLESSVEAFRLSLRRALAFEETYLDYLLDRKVISSTDFQKALRFLARDGEDEGVGSLATEIDAKAEARAYLAGLPVVDLNEYELRRLHHDVAADVATMRGLHERTGQLVETDGKLATLQALLATPGDQATAHNPRGEAIGGLQGQKVLVFTSFKDTARYLERRLTATWPEGSGGPSIRRIDSDTPPGDRPRLLGRFAPVANNAALSAGEKIDVLISTDVLSEGQNLQDCGAIVNYDLTWNPVRLVQRNGRIDRIGSPHAEIGIYNMFPEAELEALLGLVERLSGRLELIDDLGLLDSSVLGEVVHPRTFNALRRLRDEDGSILTEEEERAELAGPETLLRHLKEQLNRGGAEVLAELPHGIHSGLRREGCRGMFFAFQAPRGDGQGRRNFWRYIDARTHEIEENRFEIARRIACPPDEPRYLDEQDTFALMEDVIGQILAAEAQADAQSVASTAVDPIQQVLAEALKEAIRHRSVDRAQAKTCLVFLGQPMGRALHAQLRATYDASHTERDDARLVAELAALAAEFGKARPAPTAKRLRRGDLELICFEHISS